MNRDAAISIALGGTQFQLERFESTERLSELFTIVAEGFAHDEVDFLPHLTKPVSLEVGEAGSPAVRSFHGLLTEAQLTHVDASGSHYRLTVRPWLYLLDQNQNYRIFQDLTVVDIAKKVLGDAGMKDVDFDKLGGTYPKREYCVQYKESDFNFLSRLFEDEGIYYYFRHEKKAHKLVLCDGKSAHAKASGYEQVRLLPNTGDKGGTPDALWTWTERVSTAGQASVTLRSYDFTKPQTPVDGAVQGASQHPEDTQEVYQYLGDFEEKARGDARSKIRLAAARAQRRLFHGSGDAPGLACGGLFELKQAVIDRYNQEYLITGISFQVDAEGYRSGAAGDPRRVYVEAIASDTLYRPVLRTAKPTANGPETATVTGPDGEVISVDPHGRVKVRFHWDRSPDKPGSTSCWMRVSHHAAGEGFGNVDLPRVGQEVIVDFLNGDPDRPIITGRVYNATRKHAYDLPADKTRSLWRTQTVGEAGSYDGAEKQPPGGKGFNEVRLEDKGGSEEIYIHAQREMVTDVLLDDKLTVQRDRKTRIGRDRTTEIKHDEKLTVETGDETHEVSQGQRTTTINKDDALTVKMGDQKTTVSKGNVATTVSMGNMDTQVKMGNYTLKTSLGQVTIEAMQSITLKVGQSSVVIDQMGVTVKGMMVTSEAQVLQKVKGSMTQIEGAAMTMVKGALVMIN
ncbi:MAG: type secretion protein ImpA [Phenylobacterium sp.]|nr:type secretion protein ImpA [Phenylobacterium sp.]